MMKFRYLNIFALPTYGQKGTKRTFWDKYVQNGLHRTKVDIKYILEQKRTQYPILGHLGLSIPIWDRTS